MIDPKKFFENPEQIGLSYNNLYVIPKYSEITSRTEVDTSICLGNMTLKTPVLSANMDTITEEEMLYAMHKGGGAGVLHRFLTVDKTKEIVLRALADQINFFVSVGVGEEERLRVRELYEVGCRNFVVDIAHGHSVAMKDMLKFIKSNFKDSYVMAGNITTTEAVNDLTLWGADSIKVGLANGMVCSTKNVTGVLMPMVSALVACSKAAKVPLIADGGVREIADICKAVGLGATAVMSGFLFAGTQETPNMSSYRGMASKGAMEAQAKLKNYNGDRKIPTPEGKELSTETLPNYGISATEVCKQIAGGLRSSLSYCGARDMKHFHPQFGFKL